MIVKPGFKVYWEDEWHTVLAMHLSIVGGASPDGDNTHLLIVCSEEFMTKKVAGRQAMIYTVTPRWLKLSQVEKVAI